MANLKSTFDELIAYNAKKVEEISLLRDRHIREKQAQHYESTTKHEVIKLENSRKEAFAERDAQYQKDKAELDAAYQKDKTELNARFEKKRTQLIENDNTAIAATEGIAFDNQIRILQDAIAILKGGNV